MSRVCIRIALAVLAAGVAAAPAQASFSGENGLIAFARQGKRVETPFFIYTMDDRGGQEEKLTTKGSSRNPAWSSDGRMIAFDRAPKEGSRKRRLWVMGADGTGERKVRMGAIQAENPAWSPDGERLVFQGCGRRTKCKRDAIFVVGVDGRGFRKLAGDGIDPVWSADGRWIAFGGKLSKDACPTLNLVRPSGKRRHAITSARKDEGGQCPNAAGLDFSPDSRRLVYYAISAYKAGTFEVPYTNEVRTRYGYDSAMYTVDVDGKHRRQVAKRRTEDAGFYFLPFAWSPDGESLLWRDDRGSFIGWPDRAKRKIAGAAAGGADYAWQPNPE